MPTKFNHDMRFKNKTRGQSTCIVEHSDCDEVDTSQSFTWEELAGEAIPANARISDCWAEPLISFTDGAAGTAVLDVGNGAEGGDADELIDGSLDSGAAGDLTAEPGTILPKNGVKTLFAFHPDSYEPLITIASDVNVSTFTAGKARVTIEWEQIHAEGE